MSAGGQMKKWCEHIHSAENGRYYINGVMVGDGKMNWAGYDAPWDICPVRGCHAPRPVEKTLAEKFEDANNLFVKAVENDTRVYKLSRESAEKLAQIAEEFYKDKQ